MDYADTRYNSIYRKNTSADAEINIGSSVFFGKYMQSCAADEKEAIEWIVLDKRDGKALLISKYVLARKPFNYKFELITWASCTLRKWLNEDFLNTAFSTAEQKRIVKTVIPADKETARSTSKKNKIYDKIFLLSNDEAEKHFGEVEARRAAPTEYVIEQKCWTSDDYKTTDGKATCWWWLRSPGFDTYYTSRIGYNGNIYDNFFATYPGGGVRPALWLNIE